MVHQSLYRRYRPRSFGEIVGQEHAVAALRNAVREGTAGHAYLFSGPRGTGKTSSARILAKALNCTDPQDGEPCGTCESCLAIDAGTSVDLHEHDAASRRRIDEMRDLLGTIHLGTAGNRKVYILDEVHQLTKEAASAVLKVLEEPPAHVVWVLATTDPQKVPPTIRSRTQHFEFGLLPPEQLEKHVRWVADDAGLSLDDEAIPYVVREAKGSARDALSALERVAAAGGVAPAASSVTEIVDALAQRDVGAVLGAVARLVDAGRDPRQMTSDLVAELRDAFLSKVAPELVRRPDSDKEALAARAGALGTPLSVKAMEVLGETLVAMRDAPDARVLVEAALVRLAAPEADPAGADLAERVDRLERLAERGSIGSDTGTRTAAADAPAPAAAAGLAPAPARPRPTPTARSEPAPPQRSTLPPPPPRPGASPAAVPTHPESEAAPGGGTPSQTPPDVEPEVVPPVDGAAPAPQSATESQPAPAREPGTPSAAGLPSRDELTVAWGDELVDQVPRKVKARFSAGRFTEVSDVAVFALPDERSLKRAIEVQADFESALAERFGRPVPVQLVVGESGDAARAASSSSHLSSPPPPEPDDDSVDTTDLRDAPQEVASGVAALTEVFPGAEVLDAPDDDPSG